MAGFPLIQRRQLWVPTLAGWLVLIVCGLAMAATARYTVYPFLAPNAPAAGARLLVVEGWLDAEELDQAIAAYRRGGYQQIVTTGGPVERRLGFTTNTDYAELAAGYLQSHGLAGVPITAIPAPASAQNRTFLSAVMVRNWMAKQDQQHQAFDLFSGGAHARRSRLLYRLAFDSEIEIGILAAQPSNYDPQRWWQTSSGAKAVLGESISWLWTVGFFRPPPPGSHRELWGDYQP